MAGVVEKLKDFLMPMEEIEEASEANVTRTAVRDERTVVNGAPLDYEPLVKRPALTVHTTQIAELKVLVYVPASFDQANVIADVLKQKEAAVVNYEEIDGAEQRRLCDFLNGVCYVLNGEAKRISETMVLYVPDTVEIGRVVCARAAQA